jgi:ADP-ribose pyrophosphatase
MNVLTEHQRQALDAYVSLMASHPQLFAGRQARPIVRDPETLARYVAEHRTVLGVSADTPYVMFIVDLVESRMPDGRASRHPYLRVVSRTQLNGAVNVVVIATLADPSLGRLNDIVLLEQERHALGTRELELPRGFGEPGLTGEENALRELEEETGYVGEKAHFLGSMCPDSGLTDELVSFYHVPVVRRVASKREISEAIHGICLASRDQIWLKIRSAEMRDGFTLQALALYEKLRGQPRPVAERAAGGASIASEVTSRGPTGDR